MCLAARGSSHRGMTTHYVARLAVAHVTLASAARDVAPIVIERNSRCACRLCALLRMLTRLHLLTSAGRERCIVNDLWQRSRVVGGRAVRVQHVMLNALLQLLASPCSPEHLVNN